MGLELSLEGEVSSVVFIVGVKGSEFMELGSPLDGEASSIVSIAGVEGGEFMGPESLLEGEVSSVISIGGAKGGEFMGLESLSEGEASSVALVAGAAGPCMSTRWGAAIERRETAPCKDHLLFFSSPMGYKIRELCQECYKNSALFTQFLSYPHNLWIVFLFSLPLLC